MDLVDELMYGSISLGSTKNNPYNKKSPIKFSPLKLQRPINKDNKKPAFKLPVVNTIFGPLFKGQNVIVEWDLEEEDSFSLEYLFADPCSQEWRYMVGETEEQYEITAKARRVYKKFYRKIRPFNYDGSHFKFSTLPTLAILNQLPLKQRHTLSAGLSYDINLKFVQKID